MKLLAYCIIVVFSFFYIVFVFEMLTRKLKYNQTLEDNPCTSVVTSDEILAIICMYSGPCPVGNVALKQKYYRVRKRYAIKQIHSTNILYQVDCSEPP